MITESVTRLPVSHLKMRPYPSLEEIAAEWDQNVKERASELEHQTDTSFYEVICPNIRKLVEKYEVGSRVIDVGCGLGYLTDVISQLGCSVVGIDISPKSIGFASKRFPHIAFESISINGFAQRRQDEFDICVANMVFHNLLELEENISSIHRMLQEHGVLIASIPHPCFWHRRRVFANHSEPSYLEERYHKVYFKIRNGRRHPSPITYVHRPLGRYLTAMSELGFKLLNIVEPAIPYLKYPDLLFLVYAK